MTVVFVSNAGHTERYAMMLAEKTGLDVMSLGNALSSLPKGSEIILMGWVMGDNIQGYKKAVKLFSVKAICAVGMSKASSKTDALRKTNNLGSDMPLFVLPGGIDISKLHGFNKFIIKMMQKSISKKRLESKESPEEADLFDILINGRDSVSDENLKDVEKWLAQQSFS
ncbi:MAG: hypothetical protein ACI358_01115 [Candidatus Limimorpha sp.]